MSVGISCGALVNDDNNKARKIDIICFQSKLLMERESIKNMLNYIEWTGNFPSVIQFNDVKSDVMCCVNVPFSIP